MPARGGHSGYHLQRMKTKLGRCNPAMGHIRFNTELVKKPKDLLEYVVVHEMAHLLVPTHSEGFMALMDRHWPQWRESRAELNALPLVAEGWSIEHERCEISLVTICPSRTKPIVLLAAAELASRESSVTQLQEELDRP
jgi:Protein of unknown function DUF45